MFIITVPLNFRRMHLIMKPDSNQGIKHYQQLESSPMPLSNQSLPQPLEATAILIIFPSQITLPVLELQISRIRQ